MFDILDLPETALKKVLPKVSTRTLIRLLNAYPRTVGRTFISLLNESLSPAAMEFIKEEMNVSPPPSLRQIREAESELVKVLHEEKLFPLIQPEAA
jgi:flagellar motor switch protein FliG